jgi:hypothetical protein
VAAALGESPAEVLPRAMVSGALLLAWLWFLTRIYGRPERFLQTATAFLGVALLTVPLLVPLVAGVLGVGGAPGAAPPEAIKPSLPLLVFVAAAFYLLLVEARMLADAIEQHVFLCALLVLAGEFLIALLAMSIGMAPPTPAAAGAPA